MKYLKYLLNIPWTVLGICNLPFCIPYHAMLKKDAIVFYTLSCGLIHLYAPKVKGFCMGNVVVVRKNMSTNILEHELVHIEQYMKYPFIYIFLYWKENLFKGYWNNKFEIEAYTKSNSWPTDRKINRQ